MAHRNTREEQELLKMLGTMPFAEDTRADWVTRIETSGLTEELVDEIYSALSSAGDLEEAPADLIQHSAHFTRLVRQWRLAQQSKSFKKR